MDGYMGLTYRMLRGFLKSWPFPYGKGLSCDVVFRLLGPAETWTSFGMRMWVNPREVLGRDIFCRGEWESEITAIFREILRAGDVVVDVGANVGYYTLLASSLVAEEGLVFSFEPEAASRTRLEEHLALNAVHNVRVFPLGLGERNEEAVLYAGPSRNPGLASLRPRQGRTGKKRTRLGRGDVLVPPEIWPRVRLIKVDVEGAELGVLRGLSGLLEADAVPYLIVEVTPEYLVEMGESEEDLLTFLGDYGYSMRRITEAPPGQTWQYDALFWRDDLISQSATMGCLWER